MKLLKLALEKQNYELAAHVIVYGLVKTKIEELKRNAKKQGSPAQQPKCT